MFAVSAALIWVGLSAQAQLASLGVSDRDQVQFRASESEVQQVINDEGRMMGPLQYVVRAT